MKTALSLLLALALVAPLPALAQNGFGQTPNTGFGGNSGGFGGGGGTGGFGPNTGFGPNGGANPNTGFGPNDGSGPNIGFGSNQGADPNTGFSPNNNPSFPSTGAQQPDPMIQQLQQMAQLELQDYGVQPPSQLHGGAMHGPTPSSIPGAKVTTTAELYQLVMGNQQPYLVFDVLGGDQTLPGAIPAANAAQPGSFQDQTQQGFGQFLQQVTGGRQDAAMIFYCASTQCWMSYNAALRAANLGYRNVLWYRGGLEAWNYAGLPTMPAGRGMMPNGGGGMMPSSGGGMMPNGGGGLLQPMGN